ncbi:MAG: hypothetical protein PVH42_03205 [Desulfobacterales bacterium]|jgi:predicted P-loop ATPase
MGEIKSTLDLVLEKTKNLTLSSEEKKQQTKQEIENRIKGMVQKYQDGLYSKSELMAGYELLKKDYNLSTDDSLIIEITHRLELNRNNQSLFELLQECCTINTAAIETTIDDFQQTYHQASQNRLTQLKKDLAEQHAITGSAVLPNLDTDESWQQKFSEIRAAYENQLNRVRDGLIGGGN